MGNDAALLKEIVTHTLNDPRPRVSTGRLSLRADLLVLIFSQFRIGKERESTLICLFFTYEFGTGREINCHFFQMDYLFFGQFIRA